MTTIPIALVQFDAIPERADANLAAMERLAARAVDLGARWILFHECSVCDYTPQLARFAEAVPHGPSTTRMSALAARLGCSIGFGLAEADGGRYFITQVFVGPQGVVHSYRKTWLWREPDDRGYRNEHARFDPGIGPEAFVIDGVRATCFVCADGEAPRCLDRARDLAPQVVFYPNNRARLPAIEDWTSRARHLGAPMLVTTRTGRSWVHDCVGGCVVYAATGEVLAQANREGREEILRHDLILS